MSKKINATDWLLKKLLRGHGVTRWTFLAATRNFELSGRVAELEQRGYHIERRPVKGQPKIVQYFMPRESLTANKALAIGLAG